MITADMTDAEYHARAELSSTGARRLLDSPARFRYWQERQEPGKTGYDVGHAAHAKILGVGLDTVAYPPEHLTPSGNVSTRAATVAWAEEQRAQGLAPVSPSHVAAVDQMAEAVLSDRDARGVLETIAGREISLITNVEGVPVRARFDIFGGTRAGDLKTARDASPRGFNRAVGAHGYHVQQAWYDDAHKAETGQALTSFKFIVVESAPPHLVGVYELDFMWTDVAAGLAQKARRLWLECTESGEWPGYGAATLTAPTWAVYDADEEEIKI